MNGKTIFCLALSLMVLVSPVSGEVNGSLETVDGFRLLRLWGTHQEMGYAHGFLMAGDILTIAKDYIFSIMTPATYETVMLPLYRQWMVLPESYDQEIQGILEGMKDSGESLYLPQLERDLGKDDLGAMNCIVDLFGFDGMNERAVQLCSSVCGWGDGTLIDPETPGATLHCRNLDWSDTASHTLGHLSLIIAFTPADRGEESWFAVSFPGFIGCLSGMDCHGVGATLNMGNYDVAPSGTEPFVPICLQVRQSLEISDPDDDGLHNAEDVSSFMESQTRAPSTIVHAFGPALSTSRLDPPALVFESNVNGSAVRYPQDDPVLAPDFLAATNHHRVLYSPVSCWRYEMIRQMVTLDNQITRDEAWNIERSVRLDWTLQTMLFRPDSRDLFVTSRIDATPAPFRTPSYAAWPDMFPDEPTGTPTPLSPTTTPSPQPTSSPSPDPTSTPPDMETGIDLTLSDDAFTSGESFILSFQVFNASDSDQTFEVWIILDYQNHYWFYPDWTEEMDWIEESFHPGAGDIRTILDFTWPEVDSHAQGVFFWGAVLTPGDHQLAGRYDYVEFAF